MDRRIRIAIAAIVASVLLAGVAAAQGGDGGGLAELIRGLIDFLESILELIGGGS